MTAPPPRKVGAPRGNQNAFKHGIYSRAITKKEHAEIKFAVSGRLHSEINLFKVLIARTASSLKPLGQGSDPSFQESLAMLSTVSYAIAHLVSFYRTNERLSEDDDVPQTFLMNKGTSHEEAETEMNGPGQKPSGGQPGNTNALKHGHYASIFKPTEILKLDKVDGTELDDELGLLRTLLKRTVVLLYAQKDLAPLEHMKALRVIFYAGACVEKLECLKNVISPEETWFDVFLEAVRQADIAKWVV